MDRDAKDVPSENQDDDQRQLSSKPTKDSKCSSDTTEEKENDSSFPTSSYVQGNVNPDKVVNKIRSALQRYVLGPPLHFFEEKRERRKQKRVSDRIDQELQQGNRHRYSVMVFGPEQSGKSTIIKQLRMMYGNEFKEEEKEEIAKNIKQNVIDAILAISAAMPKLTPPIQLEKSENGTSLDYIKTCVSKSEFNYPLDIFDHVETLWKDKGIRAAYERGNEYHLADYAKYFFNRMSAIKSINYMPTKEDILYCHTPHNTSIFDIHVNDDGISDIEYPWIFKLTDITTVMEINGRSKTKKNINRYNCHVSEIVDERERRNRHLRSYFGDSFILLFVVACNTYDIVEKDNPTENRLQETIQLFKLFYESRLAYDKNIILFLNKEDLLLEKVLAGRNKLEKYFPDYASYQTRQDKYFQAGDPQEVIRAKSFILDKFKESMININPYSYSNCHFTCAVNTENIRKTFYKTCSYIIQNSTRGIIKNNTLDRYSVYDQIDQYKYDEIRLSADLPNNFSDKSQNMSTETI